jgi:hypothetical protein
MELAPDGEVKSLEHKISWVKGSETARFAPRQGPGAWASCRAGASVCHCIEEVPIIKEIKRRALGGWGALGNVPEFEVNPPVLFSTRGEKQLPILRRSI